MLRFAFLNLFMELKPTNHASASHYLLNTYADYDAADPLDFVMKTLTYTKTYGHIELEKFEYWLVLIGTFLFFIGLRFIKNPPKPPNYVKTIYNIHVCLVLIGIICLYPCLFGLYYHLLKGLFHVLGFAMCLLPFAIYYLIKEHSE